MREQGGEMEHVGQAAGASGTRERGNGRDEGWHGRDGRGGAHVRT